MSDSEERLKQTWSAIQSGDGKAAAELLPLLYSDLRRLGRALMRRESPGQTLQATALVHEAYVRVVGTNDPGWEGRGHFFGAAARAMRQILVDQARRKSAAKRGGDWKRVGVDAEAVPIEAPCDDVLALNDAIEKLEAEDPDKAKIVMLRFFAGLAVDEVATVLGLSKTKVEREWRYTRAWLAREMDEGLE